MIKKDTIQHFLNLDGIRITIADVSSAAIHAQNIHKLSSLQASILGKVLAGTAILATDFKNHEGVSVRWNTNSQLGTIFTDAYEGQFIRGFIDQADLDNVPCSEDELLENGGQITVTRYSLLKIPYSSTVSLNRGNVAQCLSQYLNQSDQTVSSVVIDTIMDPSGKVIRAAGFLAQLLPGGKKDKFESCFTSRNVNLFSEQEDSPDSFESLIREGGFAILKEAPVSFRCTCSEERIRNSLIALPQNEKEELIRDDHIEIACHYCGKMWTIPRETLINWFNRRGGDIQ